MDASIVLSWSNPWIGMKFSYLEKTPVEERLAGFERSIEVEREPEILRLLVINPLPFISICLAWRIVMPEMHQHTDCHGFMINIHDEPEFDGSEIF